MGSAMVFELGRCDDARLGCLASTFVWCSVCDTGTDSKSWDTVGMHIRGVLAFNLSIVYGI